MHLHREIKITADGSPTLFVPDLDEHYHSVHGAYRESMHVFIQNGLHYMLNKKQDLNILEIGLGTGLNVVLSCREITGRAIRINYFALEPFPVEKELAKQIVFPQLNENIFLDLFSLIHQCGFEKPVELLPNFIFTKHQIRLEDFSPEMQFDLVYFDAFGPRTQPEIWSFENFEKLFRMMNNDSCLVTYCAKGEVRRTMQQAGFRVERLEGPPGKREMLRALK